MKARILDGCTGCSLCESICPDVFRMNDDNLAEVYADITPKMEDQVKEAADSCPASVIEVV